MIKEMFGYYKPYKIIVLGIIIGSSLMAVLDLLFPILVREIINVVLPAQDTTRLVELCAMLLGLYIVNFGLIYAVNYYGHVMSVGIENNMRHDLFEHLEKLSFTFFDNNKTGQLLSRITTDITEVCELTFRGPNDLFICTISMLGTMGILFYMNKILGFLICFLLLAKAIHTVIINKKMKACFRESRKKSGEVSARAEETLSGIRLVKAFAQEKLELNRFMQSSNELFQVRANSFNILSYFSASVNFFTNFTNLAVLFVGGYFIAAQKLALSDFVAFLLYVNLFMKPILRLTVFAEMYQRGMAGFARFHELLHTEPSIVDAPTAKDKGQLTGDICFEDVTFNYGGKTPLLENFSLQIPAGKKIAFVGATGTGKTTLVSLLLRFYEPERGKILIDGKPLQAYTQKFLHEQIGLVQQDVFLFSDTVNFNIAYGKQEATAAEITEAATLAAADTFINYLPKKYETCIGERGVKLSGGQKQRLAIARVFLKNPPIIVLDEATSALDNKTEQIVQACLDKLAHGRTTLIIAHRLSTIVGADLIVVLDKGKIVEQGTHAELLAKQGVYAKLYAVGKDEHVQKT